MSLDQGDSLLASKFGFQIDGVQVETLQSVEGLKQGLQVVESQSVTAQGKPMIKKQPGPVQAGEVTLVRGANQGKEMTDWIKKAMEGDAQGARKNASIIVYDTKDTEVKRFNMTNAWASETTSSQLEAGGAQILTESVTVVFEEGEWQ